MSVQQPAEASALTEVVAAPPTLEGLLSSSLGREAMARGSLNLLSLRAVRESMGPRWESRSEHVWAYVRQSLERRFSSIDVIERVSDVDVMVLTAAEGGIVAQGACARGLREILVHFLGGCRQDEVTVRTVVSAEGGALRCAEVDTRQALAPKVEVHAAHQETARKGAAHAAALEKHVRGYSLGFAVENIVSIRHDALAGGRLRRLVTPNGRHTPLPRKALTDLDTATLARIDLATLSLANELLTGPSSAVFPVLRTPVALQTLGHSSWRAAYVGLLRSLPREVSQRILVELVNLDEGTPAIRIGEATMLLAGAARGVIAFTDPNIRALQLLKDNRLMGVTINAAQLGKPNTDRRLAIMAFAEAAKRVTLTTAIRGSLSPEEIAAARYVNVTYLIDTRKGRARKTAAPTSPPAALSA